jgi:hypothetical protein
VNVKDTVGRNDENASVDDPTARELVLARLSSGLATVDELATATGLQSAVVESALASALSAGLASRIDLPGSQTWRCTGAGLLYGVFPESAPAEAAGGWSRGSPPAAAGVRPAVSQATVVAAQSDPEGTPTTGADAGAGVDEAWRGWAKRWLRYAYQEDRLDSEQIVDRLDGVEAATTLRELDQVLTGIVRVPAVEAEERAQRR